MTTFVLVPGGFTGGWVWEETAARLGRAGAEAHPVTLTGMDGLSGETGIGLETHVEDLVRLIDGLAAAEVVLVGHGYGLHPVLGAADRRPGRVARIVALDTILPQDGEPAERSVPDPGAGPARTDGSRRRRGRPGPGGATSKASPRRPSYAWSASPCPSRPTRSPHRSA